MKALYFKTKLTEVINITRIVTVHYFEFDASFSTAGEKHDFWELVYADKGRIRIRTDREDFVLSQGEICFHRPNEFHRLAAHESAPNIFIVSFVCGSPTMSAFADYRGGVPAKLRKLLAGIVEEANATFLLPHNDPGLKQLTFRENPVFGGTQLLKSYLEQFLILMIRSAETRKNSQIFFSKEVMDDCLVKSVREYAKAHAEEKISLSDVCKAVSYGKSYLSRLFRESTGESIAHYCTVCKIERAKERIREGSDNFTMISDRLAFDNPQYFSRVFRRISGMTPSEFRNSLQSKLE